MLSHNKICNPSNLSRFKSKISPPPTTTAATIKINHIIIIQKIMNSNILCGCNDVPGETVKSELFLMSNLLNNNIITPASTSDMGDSNEFNLMANLI